MRRRRLGGLGGGKDVVRLVSLPTLHWVLAMSSSHDLFSCPLGSEAFGGHFRRFLDLACEYCLCRHSHILLYDALDGCIRYVGYLLYCFTLSAI